MTANRRPRNRHSRFDAGDSGRAFTLLELLVVTALMALVVGLLTLKLDGLTASGRARSLASQVASYVRLAQIDARTSGQSRIVEIDAAHAALRVRRGTNVPGPVQPYTLGSSARLAGVWTEDGYQERNRDPLSMRIDGHGRFKGCAILFQAQQLYAIAVLSCVEPPCVVVLSEKPHASNLAELRRELKDRAVP